MSDLKADLASLRLNEAPETSRKGLWILLAVVIVALGGGALAWRSANAAVEVATVTPSVERRSTAPAGTPVLTASGYIVARREAIVSSKIQGRLSELRVEEGSQLREGDLIARLESSDFVANVARAQAQVQQAAASQRSADASIQRAEADVAEARRQLGVSERLIADKLVPVDQLDANKSRVKLAEAALAQASAERERTVASAALARADLTYAQAQLQNTVIRAPFSGTVVRKMAEIGESVAPIPPGVNISTASGAIVALADLATLEMEADVNEANVAKLTEGQPAEITVEAFPDRKYKAVLRQVIPTADRTKATVLTKVTLIDKDKDLKPEMSAKVTFLEPQRAEAPVAVEAVPAKSVILVPQSAVVNRDGPKVFEIVGDRVQMRTIATGAVRGDRVIVTDGLAGSETLVDKPAETLKDGAAVKKR
ncbi:MAG: efflux RND transporter periplasmic adaptor subunit [Vicinamibacteria bacterium]|nr:efflux RND transporter periplasmic adaptor subunit [Vicinamibacteria bacterium]